MEYSTWFYFTSIASFLIFLFLLTKLLQNQFPQKPSPPRLPIIGHLHLFRAPLMYRTLESLSKKYGPILPLRFGSCPVLVLSSPSAVKELFSRNDLVFANRPRVLFGELLNYNSTTLGTTPYGDHWRNLRRISTLEMLSAAKLNSSFGIRQEEVRSLLKNLFRNSREDFVKVEMKSRLSELTFNVITRMVAGTKYFGNEAADSLDATEFRRIISDILSYATLNLGDYVPIFRWIDFRNVKRRMLKIHKKMDVFMQGLMNENRRKDKEVSEQNGGKTKSRSTLCWGYKNQTLNITLMK